MNATRPSSGEGAAAPSIRSRLANALLVWSLDASGDAAPLQAIRGNQTGMLAIGAPIWVPADAIFADSFD